LSDVVERAQTKACAMCGREMAWRRKWARNWDQVRYCSDACRKHRPTALDRALERAIVDLLRARGSDKTICPSEAARRVAAAHGIAWRSLLQRTRSAARRLADAGVVEITQRGRRVAPSRARGAIRLRLRG
jgi:hypothetical protein